MEEEYLVVLMTAPNVEVGQRIARSLVENRLAACVNLLPPMQSIYRWQGEVLQDEESLLIAKTRRSRLAELAASVQSLHPYEVPEIIALQVADGAPAYLNWLDSETRP